MKRILIFSLAYHPHVGGAEVAVKEITDRIKDIEFHILTLNFGGETQEEKKENSNIFVHRVGDGSSYLSKILFIPHAVLRARILHHERPFDAFWAMMSYMLFPTALLRMSGVRVPYVLTLQEGDPFSHMFGRWFILPFRPLLSYGFRNASAITAISTYLAQWAKKMGYRGTVEVIPNGYLTVWFGKDHSMQNRLVFWKNRHKIDGSKRILITTSRLVRKNAVDIVIKSLQTLPENIHFVILGKGEEEGSLRKLATELRVSDRVHFCGEVSNTDVANHLPMSNIFIRPSRSEGMGNSFIEAMAAGLPVIATQEGGIADFLFDEKRNPDKEPTGWAVDKDSPGQIAAAVQEILAHPEKVARVTATAKKLIAEKYDWNLIAKQMQAVFNGVFGRR